MLAVPLGCGGGKAPAPQPSVLGTPRLHRLDVGGQPSGLVRLAVAFSGDRGSAMLLNVAADLDGDGKVSAAEWLVVNTPVAVQQGEQVMYLAAETSQPTVRLQVALGAQLLPAGWDGKRPADADHLEAKVELVPVAITPARASATPGRYGAPPAGLPVARPVGAGAPTRDDGTSVLLKDTPNIAQGDFECLPTTIAGNLTYLARKNNESMLGTADAPIDVGIPADHVGKNGSVNDGVADLRDAIKKGMGPLFHEPMGDEGGVDRKDLVKAKHAAVKALGLGDKVVTSLINPKRGADGMPLKGPDGMPTDEPGSDGAGVYDAIKEALRQGCVVEVGIRYKPGAAPDPTMPDDGYGHIVNVVGFAEAGGKASVYLQDPARGAIPGIDVRGDAPPISQPEVQELGADHTSLPGYQNESFRDMRTGKARSTPGRLEFAIKQCWQKTQQTGCAAFQPGTYAASLLGVTDNGGHQSHIGNPFAGSISVSGGSGSIAFSGGSPFVPVSGSLDASCGVSATGQGTVAGQPGVSVELRGTVSGSEITGTYRMGTRSELPGGGDITYRYRLAKE